MEKKYTSLACPFCHANGTNIKYKKIDECEKEGPPNCTIINIKRTYNCYCKNCGMEYNVDYGRARLIRYNPFINAVQDNVKLYVEYESEFDRSYEIVEVDDIPMIIMEDDKYPIILDKNHQKELISNHEETKRYTYNTWMSRHK